MRLVWTVTVECDPPPADEELDDALDVIGDAFYRLEDAIGTAIMDAGASFVIDTAHRIEP